MWFSRSLLFPSLKTLHLPLERPSISWKNRLTRCRCLFHHHHLCCLQVLLADRPHSHVRLPARRRLLLGPHLWHLYRCFARLMRFQRSAARPAGRLAGRPFPARLLPARFRTRHVRLLLDGSASSTPTATRPPLPAAQPQQPSAPPLHRHLMWRPDRVELGCHAIFGWFSPADVRGCPGTRLDSDIAVFSEHPCWSRTRAARRQLARHADSRQVRHPHARRLLGCIAISGPSHLPGCSHRPELARGHGG